MTPVSAISEAQLQANRENAQLSTGPKSEQGKSRVRLNGLQHGLTGNTVLMPYEDTACYEAFVAGIVATLQPEGPTEQDLAHSIADGRWRLNRARAIEENVFALGAITNPVDFGTDPSTSAALTQAQTFLENAQKLQLLTLYAGRIDRSIRKNAADLKELQATRRAAHDQALEQAILLAQLAESKRESYDPTADGFGFSKAFLDRHMHLQRRLAEARRQFPATQTHQKNELRRAA